MKKIKIPKIIWLILLIVLTFTLSRIYQRQITADDAYATGNIKISYLGTPMSGPIFNVTNMLPGFSEERIVRATNNGDKPYLMKIRSIRSGSVEIINPKLESALLITIFADGNTIYGGNQATPLEKFFTDSQSNFPLTKLDPGQTVDYKFKIWLPFSTGNPFQGKSVVFDLIFNNQPRQVIKINEVYYSVDNKHGGDCDKNRKSIQSCKDAGWLSLIPVSLRNKNIPGIGSPLCGCSCSWGQCNEWVELYNPTDASVNLKGWQLTDNSGKITLITAKKIIPAHGFAIVTKDTSVKLYWKIKPGTLLVELGTSIGDGLDNSGDHLDLVDPLKNVIDRVGWGSDILVWNPAVTLVTTGSSIGRLTPGFDNDLVTDWQKENPPSPGN